MNCLSDKQQKGTCRNTQSKSLLHTPADVPPQGPVKKSFFRLFRTCCITNECSAASGSKANVGTPSDSELFSTCGGTESPMSQAVQHYPVTFSGLWSACCSMAVTFQRDGERDRGTCEPSREKMFHPTHACACDGSPQYLQQRSRAACSQLL